MKKILKILIVLFFAYSCYHLYKCGNLSSDSSGKLLKKQEAQIKSLQAQVDSLYKISHQLAFDNSEYLGKISDLKDTISRLDASNLFLIEQINASIKEPQPVVEEVKKPITNNNIKTEKKKNEKNTRIARNDAAVQLQKFFTDRYDGRE